MFVTLWQEIKEGWRCPTCWRCYSPAVEMCQFCPAPLRSPIEHVCIPGMQTSAGPLCAVCGQLMLTPVQQIESVTISGCF